MKVQCLKCMIILELIKQNQKLTCACKNLTIENRTDEYETIHCLTFSFKQIFS
uniref:Uncharacterized protein n=1 Tax=viral metagenome TaxID=1070528 RepID=A0A6C0IED4_9ZZZZ